MKPKSILSSLVLAAVVFLSGCATHITTTVVNNPAPAEKFSDFKQFELTKIALVAPYAGQDANEAALKKIQEHLSNRMDPVIAKWNEAGSNGSRTLLIEPTITEIKFINGAARFWAGAMSGDSAVILKAKITDKQSGNVIATPEFYAKANAMGGAWSMGGSDNAMLERIANRLADYLIANYPAAVGGASGLNL
jgi:hypothetical protein